MIALLVLMIWLSERFMLRHVAEGLEAEVHILESDFEVDGREGVISLIRLRVQSEAADPHRLYRLQAADGSTLAANLSTWPAVDAAAGETVRMPHPLRRDGGEMLARWVQLSDGSRLLVGFDEHEVHQVRSDLRRAGLWSLGAMLLVSLAAGLLLTRAALKPIESIRISALRIMGGDLRHRIPIRGTGDEFDRLGVTLNAMLDRIEHLIASVKGATDNIAHDLRSPLTRHRARLEAALRATSDDEPLPTLIERSLIDIDQVLATFQSLLRIASVESGLLRNEFRRCDIAALIRDAVDFVEPLAEQASQRIHQELADGLHLQGHRNLLFQALINLLDNAVKYGPEQGEIRVLMQQQGANITIEILDQGPGIPLSERERVFERLYRLDRARSAPGLGLGLSLVRAIAQVHGGTVSVLDSSAGARVELRLPINADGS